MHHSSSLFFCHFSLISNFTLVIIPPVALPFFLFSFCPLTFPFVIFSFLCPSTFFFTFSLYLFSPVRLPFFSPSSKNISLIFSVFSLSSYINHYPFICIFLYSISTLLPLSLFSLATSLNFFCVFVLFSFLRLSNPLTFSFLQLTLI
jgi:hypothetical protein